MGIAVSDSARFKRLIHIKQLSACCKQPDSRLFGDRHFAAAKGGQHGDHTRIDFFSFSEQDVSFFRILPLKRNIIS
ncbi:Uncharacterised protein [Mycobacteroides abscessus subsp. abscessus]|nr:Uncharacterised protein [Mycobacteroides abscessus subsp. abscessus]